MELELKLKSNRIVVGILLAIAFAIGGMYAGCSVKALALFSAIAIGESLFELRIDRPSIQAVISFSVILISAFANLYLAQLCMNEGIAQIRIEYLFLGVMCCFIPEMIMYIVTMKPQIIVALSTALTLIFSTVNHYVYAFRGNEFRPTDFLSAKIALSVVDKYTFSLEPCLIYAWILGTVFIFSSFAVRFIVHRRGKNQNIMRGIMCAVMLLFASVLSNEVRCIELKNWANNGTIYNGFVLNFTAQALNTNVEKPKNYGVKELQQLNERYYNGLGETQNTPNIIVIMDESYSDFSIYRDTGAFATNMPAENCIHGYALTSIYGGSTPNSEYEFLTGNSMAFLPAGSVPYQAYLKDNTYSMVSVLHEYGYQCVSMHPYYASGWMRNAVYPLLGFDESYFLEDFPQKNLIREYVSDQEMFERIVDRFENKESPLFLFGVTMQNHGGYDYEGDNFKKTVSLDGFTCNVAEAEQYLSLLRETDNALEYLLHYFSEVEEPTLIVFFGDHQPAMDQSFLKELYGKGFDTLDDQQRMYIVPFFLWANYDMEEAEVELTSLNYLSNYVYQAAGIPLPAYNRFLSDVQEVIPAMNSMGYFSLRTGTFLPYKEASSDEEKLLTDYQILQYNSLFDMKDRSNIFCNSARGTNNE